MHIMKGSTPTKAGGRSTTSATVCVPLRTGWHASFSTSVAALPAPGTGLQPFCIFGITRDASPRSRAARTLQVPTHYSFSMPTPDPTSRPDPPRSEDVLPDVLSVDLDIVFCGTAPGKASAAARAYYAHPQNRFWRALHESGLTDHRLEPKTFPTLLTMRLGLTDLAKRVSGNDNEVDRRHFEVEALTAKIERFRPCLVAFTSKTAAKVFLKEANVDYGLHARCIGITRIFVLPSPSGSARGHWSLDPWRDLARIRSDLRSCASSPD